MSNEAIHKLLIILFACMAAIVIGLIGGVLAALDGNSLPAAFLYGAGAFGAAITIEILVAGFWFGVGERSSGCTKHCSKCKEVEEKEVEE
ncbi:hypothetical protein [Actinomadura sp. 3N508]|uniref:hypothetical protein n=1 Tax=Actinomadura sp. 3N508 TaxID=3375153 RepID=UPI00379A7493